MRYDYLRLGFAAGNQCEEIWRNDLACNENIVIKKFNSIQANHLDVFYLISRRFSSFSFRFLPPSSCSLSLFLFLCSLFECVAAKTFAPLATYIDDCQCHAHLVGAFKCDKCRGKQCEMSSAIYHNCKAVVQAVQWLRLMRRGATLKCTWNSFLFIFYLYIRFI